MQTRIEQAQDEKTKTSLSKQLEMLEGMRTRFERTLAEATDTEATFDDDFVEDRKRLDEALDKRNFTDWPKIRDKIDLIANQTKTEKSRSDSLLVTNKQIAVQIVMRLRR